MAITKSAKKAHKRAIKNRASNLVVKTNLKDSIKSFRKSLLAGTAKAEDVTSLYSIIDKSAKKRIIHKNTASRLKSRLASKVSTKTETKKAKKESE